MPYSNFNTEDFVKDPYFQVWVLQDDPEVNSFWELWMELYPEQKETVAAGIEILLNKNIEEIPAVSEKHIKTAWQQLNRTIDSPVISINNPSYLSRPKKYVFKRMSLAAIITGLIMLALGFLFYQDQQKIVTYTSVNSQVLPVNLPDGSKVILNANSSVSFKKNWYNKHQREVWLKGEAFFSVTKNPIKGSPTFVVHANKVQVQVLGTSFNVADRETKTQVILNSGKVKLFVTGLNKSKAVNMLPGDYVAFGKKDNQFTKTKVNPESFSGWRYQKLIFNNTPIPEILAQIEQTYGTPINLTDTTLIKRTFTGTFPNNNLPILLQTLEKAFRVQVNQKGKTLTIIKN